MKLLIVEDDPVNLLLVKNLLNPLGHEIVTAIDGSEAMKLLAETIFDLLLFDVMIPEVDGLALTRNCRSDPRHRDVPILLLTALANKASLVEGFEAGATDYVVKPFHAPEMLHRVKAQLSLRNLQLTMERTLNELNLQVLQVEKQKRELERKERDLLQANLLLGEANKILVEQASRDSLTNLLNRRKGWDFMDYEEEKSRRTQKPIGVVLLDLDRFKSINDTLGHEVGDKVLKATSHCLAETLRATDILIRWGGEEFLVVMPEADTEGVTLAAEKIRKAVEQRPWEETAGFRVTTSIGATVKTPQDTWDAAVKAADRALYQAKEAGRNRVVFTETE